MPRCYETIVTATVTLYRRGTGSLAGDQPSSSSLSGLREMISGFFGRGFVHSEKCAGWASGRVCAATAAAVAAAKAMLSWKTSESNSTNDCPVTDPRGEWRRTRQRRRRRRRQKRRRRLVSARVREKCVFRPSRARDSRVSTTTRCDGSGGGGQIFRSNRYDKVGCCTW